jgi:hypothetical protein
VLGGTRLCLDPALGFSHAKKPNTAIASIPTELGHKTSLHRISIKHDLDKDRILISKLPYNR